MNRIITITAGAALAALLPLLASAEEHVTFERHSTTGQGETAYFNNEHSETFIWDGLEALTGSRPAQGASRSQLAQLVAAELDKLPKYGMKHTEIAEARIPRWVLEGQARLAPANISKSRYLIGVNNGTYQEDADLGALYGYFCMYDAEWFALARNPGYKAWLSTVALTYPPAWMSLGKASEASLHNRLVTPLQTKDEPLREIDNWITAFTRPAVDDEPLVFAKPIVRSTLVGELLSKAGLEVDPRFLQKTGYSAPNDSLGLSERNFYLLAALTLELSQELYAQDPGDSQPLHFRDYFAEEFYRNSR